MKLFMPDKNKIFTAEMHERENGEKNTKRKRGENIGKPQGSVPKNKIEEKKPAPEVRKSLDSRKKEKESRE